MDEAGTLLELPKTEKVLASIRSRIVTGRYTPGFRLPTFVEMEQEHAVGRAVIQHALATLKRDGFIRSEGRRGLFVTENPPHLFQYGLVMPCTPGDPGWCSLMTAMNNEAFRLEKIDPQRRFRFYYGIKPGTGTNRSLDQLRDDIENHRLAGLIIDHDATPIISDLLKSQPDLPRVYLWADEVVSDVTPCLTVDGPQLLARSLRLLKERGCERVAVVHMSGVSIDIDHRATFAEVGLRYRAPWVQWVGRSDPAAAKGLVTLLMDYAPEARPDGLVVTDDNLVSHVSSGLVESGVKVGEELQLVAHCNWPWPPRSVLPMVRIGFDLREALHRAMATINRQREGKSPESYQRLAPQFEWETTPDPV